MVSGKGKEEKKPANKHLPKKRIQYATRGKRHSFCEPEVPDDDHYICEWNNYNFLNSVVSVYPGGFVMAFIRDDTVKRVG